MSQLDLFKSEDYFGLFSIGLVDIFKLSHLKNLNVKIEETIELDEQNFIGACKDSTIRIMVKLKYGIWST